MRELPVADEFNNFIHHEKNLIDFRSHDALPADDAGSHQSTHHRRFNDGGV